MDATMPARIAGLRPTVSTTQHFFCESPSPSISEMALGSFDPNDSLLNSAFQALKSCRAAAEGTHAACIATHRDTTMSEGARHVTAAKVADEVTKRPLPLADIASRKLATEINRIETQIKAPATSTMIRAVHIDHELRQYLRDLSDPARRRTITKSLESGDDTILSAIMSGPPCLSGLSDAEVSSYAMAWRRKRFPDELARLGQLEKALAAVQLGGSLLASYGQKMASPAIVEQAKRFQKTTADAIAAATGVN